jgi:peptide/nickel transport system substrate-binding protein
LLGIALIFIVLFQLVSEEEAPPIAMVEVPVAGGSYIEGVLGYSETINPILAPAMVPANPLDQDLSSLVFDGLTSLDVTGQISPSLAIDWDVSEDGTIYEFRMREDVTWQDGAPFTAADVAFTIQAMQDPNYRGPAALRELWRNVTVEQLDRYSLRFVLEEPFSSFLYYTTIGILPAHLLSAVPAGDLPTHEFSTQQPVGTGMFKVERVSAEEVVLAANPDYWGHRPSVEQVEFWLFGSEEDLLAAYDAGEIHGFQPTRAQDSNVLAQKPNLQFYSAQSPGYSLIYVNMTRETVPFFQETEVRQALLYALDRQKLIDQALGGQALIADSPILPYHWAYIPSIRHYRYDPERAIGLLDASGWQDSDADRIRDKDGQKLAFTLLINDDPVMVQLAEEMARQWNAVGVEVTIRSTSSDAVNTFVRNRNFDAVLVEIGLTADPDPYPLWHSTQAETGQNFSGWASAEADVVMEESRFASDPEQLTELYSAFQRIFAEEVPALLLYYPIYTYAVDEQVLGMQLSPLWNTVDRFRNIHEWYVQIEEIEISETDEFDKPSE